MECTRILKFLKRRNSRGHILEKRSFWTNSNRFRFPFGAIEEKWLIQSGRTSIQVSFVDMIISAFRYLTFGSVLWLDNYTKLCSIEADLSHLPLPAQSKSSGLGSFYRLDYDLVLLFGLTEMKAQVVYKDKVGWHKLRCVLQVKIVIW